MMANEQKRIKFMLNGCDIWFTAEAPVDMTVEQLVTQASRIIPDWCRCGICKTDQNSVSEIIFDYEDVKKSNDDVTCQIRPKEESSRD